ncbi:MAG: SCO family protein [Burkholderiaceae bacterium]|nr:SCO family protein [Burkholderiaceae bacterium]
MHKRNALQWLAAGALSISASALLTGCSKSGPSFHAVDITGSEYARDFRLSDHNGQMRSLQDFRGKVVAMFFGFTQCPDVCPTAMQELAEAKRLLGPDAERLQGIFITLDPERDQAEMLKAYMGNFDPSFLALRPTPQELPALAKDFKIYYKKVDGKTPTSYTLDHSAGSYLYDTNGKLRLYARHASGAKALADDVRTLLNNPA